MFDDAEHLAKTVLWTLIVTVFSWFVVQFTFMEEFFIGKYSEEPYCKKISLVDETVERCWKAVKQ